MLTPALRPPTDKAEVIALSSPCPGPDEQRARTQGAPLAAAASAYVVTLVPPGIPWALVQTSAAVGNGRSPTSALGQKRRLDHCPVTSGVPPIPDISLHYANCRDGPRADPDVFCEVNVMPGWILIA
jgi:hypothetical protein